eukprot:6477119-Amphidinium_carterae.1
MTPHHVVPTRHANLFASHGCSRKPCWFSSPHLLQNPVYEKKGIEIYSHLKLTDTLTPKKQKDKVCSQPSCSFKGVRSIENCQFTMTSKVDYSGQAAATCPISIVYPSY